MKILFLNTYYHPHNVGGAELVLRSLANGLGELGHEVYVFASGDRGSRSEIKPVDSNEVKVIRVPCSNIYWPYNRKRRSPLVKLVWHVVDRLDRVMAAQLRNVINDIRPDVICTHNLQGLSALSWSVIKESGIPHVHVLHDLQMICSRTNMRRNDKNCETVCLDCACLRVGIRRKTSEVDFVIGVSDFILKRHIQHGYFVEARKCVINNATKNQAAVGVQSRTGQFREATVFGFLGRIEKSKGIELLLQSFSMISGDQVALIVGGSGEPCYEAELKDRHQADRIQFLGQVKPDDFFPKIDVLIVPSIGTENFPSVIMEAYAFGKPVIGAMNGGIPEMIVDGVSGMLFETGNASLLQQSIIQMSDSRFRSDLASGVKMMSKKFSDFELYLEKYENVFRQAIDLTSERA